MNIIRVFVVSLIILLLIIVFYKNKTYCNDCNIILISVDTLREDHLSLNGYGRKTSPNIDNFAKESIVYKNVYATAPWTLPSHASMFASDYPSELKTESMFDRLPENTNTIAQILHKYGYYTYGFDADTYISPKWNFSLGYDGFTIENTNYKDGIDVNFMFPHAIDWLKKNRAKKFFLLLHTFEIHDPYCPPKKFASQFNDGYIGETDCISDDLIYKNIRGEVKLSNSELKHMEGLYDSEISYTDYYIGQFIDFLKKSNFYKNTIVIITSDHGEEFGEHGTWGKHAHTLYNELLKVPLIIKAPGLKPEVNVGAYSMVDVAPTILDLLGLPAQNSYKGQSLRNNPKIKPIYFEIGDTGMELRSSLSWRFNIMLDIKPTERKKKGFPQEQIGTLVDNWKLICHVNSQKTELYNLSNDPMEKKNLISSKINKAVELKKILIDHYGKFADNSCNINNADNYEILNRLRSVGY